VANILDNVIVLKPLLSGLAPYPIEGMDQVLLNLQQRTQLAFQTQVVPKINVNVLKTRKVAKPSTKTETRESVTYEPTIENYMVDVSYEIPGPGLGHFLPIVRQAIARGHVYTMPGYNFAQLYATRNALQNQLSQLQNMALNTHGTRDVRFYQFQGQIGPVTSSLKAANEAIVQAVAQAHVASGIGRTYGTRQEFRSRPGAPRPVASYQTVNVLITI